MTRPHHWMMGILLALAPMMFFHFAPAPNIARAQSNAYLNSEEECASCHRNIWITYQRTGMARSFYRPSPSNTVEDFTKHNVFYHQPSGSYFIMLQRDGKYYQRRHQIDFAGKQINVMEKKIDYVLGSGNHARTYVNRTAANKLIELPLAWYSEKGGYWAMNPGYDRPNHDGFRRALGYDCMFCHNAYPEIPVGNKQPFAEPVYKGSLPAGIDCQRCHGPGGNHVRLAKQAGAKAADIRGSIVNPSRLSAERQLEVCMQCHLETTSFPLPNSLTRYERGPFSYKPGEALGESILFFDHAPGKGRDDKFEIANSAYRLRRSACFLESKGKLSCTTCHNPHDIPRGEEATSHYTAVCRQCHNSALDHLVASAKHPASGTCTECHMPKRRTEDVVHAVVTDHYIQRRKPIRDLLADMAERHEADATAYRGKVVLYYPKTLPHTAANDLDLALAQVIEKSNLPAGIQQLTAAIRRHAPKRPEYYLELAEALRTNGQLGKAIPFYREAVRRNPKFAPGLQKLGVALRRSGQYPEAQLFLKQAAAAEPENATTWHELGLVYRARDKKPDAIAALLRALELDPDLSEAFNNLGVIYFAQGEQARAESAFLQAIRIQPDFADAHGNLANLLSASGNLPEARHHFAIALRLNEGDAATRYNYAVLLGRTRQFDEAQRELESALRTDPKLVDAHMLLGDLLLAKGQAQVALEHYREVVRLQPDSGKARLGLGTALVALGDLSGAVPHLRKAASDSTPAVREAAVQVLRQLGK